MQPRFWTDYSIKRRITIAYVIFILIPFCLLSIHSYIQTRAFQSEQLSNSLQQTLSVQKSAIEGKLNLVESISNNITYNARLNSFLSEPFDNQSGAVEHYLQIISPIVSYSLLYNQVEINDIKIYMTNHSIPEGFGSFYHDTVVLGEVWYTDFIDSEERSAWIPNPNENTYVYLQKIVNLKGDFLGVTTVSALKGNLFASLNNMPEENAVIYLTDEDGLLQYGSKNIALPTEALNHTPSGQIELGGILYISKQVDRLHLNIGMMDRLSQSWMSFQLLTTLGFITAIVLSILLFYQVLKTTFIKIKASIRAMDQSIRTGFIELVPVERNDEIGVIAEKFNTLLVRISTLVGDMVKRETIHKDAQLKALQSQINPHFIYNTINLFSAKAEIAGMYDVSEAFAEFGQMLRYNMNDESHYASIRQEINHVQSYIGIQKLRYGERLDFTWSCEHEFIQQRMIRFIFQPVVENCITHGMNQQDQLCVKLEIKRYNDQELIVSITDNGKGIPIDKLQRLNSYFRHEDQQEQVVLDFNGSGIGLKNINHRLRLFYGEDYFIRLDSVEQRYTRITIRLPYFYETEDDRNAEPTHRG
ncbi:histidine kinase [Paenibacillus sp. ACRSA]|uniref:sensor histidine kinase n=1 Tax=Paenibacillus sp. ACRSA TaxID=2918211 RepID=UPI001EF5A595|nr:sensor histidine kinase [Paenibacillus sp. ACRSA]MCG7378704.1 histidine kinase [Paenibacillus sp. ACRSA]